MNTNIKNNINKKISEILPRVFLYSILVCFAFFGSPVNLIILAIVIYYDVKTRGELWTK